MDCGRIRRCGLSRVRCPSDILLIEFNVNQQIFAQFSQASRVVNKLHAMCFNLRCHSLKCVFHIGFGYLVRGFVVAGGMKRKRRKNLKQAWMHFQSEHDLPDEDLSVARAIGFPLPQLQEKISHSEFASLTTQQAIHQLHAIHQQQLAERRAAIAAGTLKPKVKKSKPKKSKHDPAWVMAKKLCRLNQDDIQKANVTYAAF